MKRSGIQRRSAPLSRGSGLKAKPRPRLGVQERQEAQEFREAINGQWFCAACGKDPIVAGSPHRAHHVVYKQHLRPEERWNPRNALAVCDPCHEAHHNGSRRIPLECLTDDNLNFASAVLGASAGDYLRRRYGGSIVTERNGAAPMARPAPRPLRRLELP